MKKSVLAVGILACAELFGGGYRASEAVVVAPDVFFGPRKAHSIANWGGAAADDLTNALKLVTGRTIALYRESDTVPKGVPVIYIGDVKAAHDSGTADRSLRNFDFRVRTVGDRTYLWSKTATGASYAVSDFLARQCGYYMLTISGDDPYDENPDLTIKPCDYTERAVIYRHESYYGRIPTNTHPKAARNWRDYSGFSRRMRTRFREEDIESEHRLSRQVRWCHSSFNYLPPEKYWKDHPEYYSMDKTGKRRCIIGTGVNCGQLCYSNPEVLKICTENLLRFIAADRKAFPDDYPCVYDFTQQDGMGYLCLCPECKKVIARYNRVPGGNREGGDMGLQLEFINRIVRDVRKQYPDVKIRIFAYVSTEDIPVGIVPEENIIVWMCDLYTLSDHMRPLSHPFNAPRRKLIEEWAKIAPELELWDYMTYCRLYSRGRTFPEVSVDAYSSDAKFFRDVGIQRIFMQDKFDDQPFFELNAYVQGRCYWNPDYDVETLIDEYCRVYGKGAPKMREAIDIIRRKIAANPPGTTGDWFERRLTWRNLGFYEPLRKVVQAAYDAAERPVERARIANVLASINDELYNFRGGSTPSDRELRTRDRENTMRYRIEALTAEVDDPDIRAALAKELKAEFERRREIDELRFDKMPPGVSADDLFIVCFDRRSMSVPRNKACKIDDPAAWRGEAVELSGKVDPSAIDCGFYDWPTKASSSFKLSVPEKERDGRYRWYKVGRGKIGQKTIFRFGGWANHVLLQRCYLSADGADKDPNVLDCWMSVACVDGKVRVDKIALRRQ